MTESQRQTIRNAVSEHGNILVIGGTGSGKTTLINAILYDMSEQNPNERLYISEDTGEIQCHSQNKVQVYTTGSIDLTKLVKTALRYRPDRIIVGEVRGRKPWIFWIFGTRDTRAASPHCMQTMPPWDWNAWKA